MHRFAKSATLSLEQKVKILKALIDKAFIGEEQIWSAVEEVAEFHYMTVSQVIRMAHQEITNV